MITRALLFATLWSLCAVCSADQRVVPGAKNVGEFLAMGQMAVASSRVGYCVTAMPSRKRELRAELASFRAKFNDAIKPTLERISRSATLSRPIPDGLVDTFQAQMDGGLQEFRKAEAGAVCESVLDALKNATVSSIRGLSEQALDGYEEAVQDGVIH